MSPGLQHLFVQVRFLPSLLCFSLFLQGLVGSFFVFFLLSRVLLMMLSYRQSIFSASQIPTTLTIAIRGQGICDCTFVPLRFIATSASKVAGRSLMLWSAQYVQDAVERRLWPNVGE